jgi:PIN domain nuclease of toxin-antitoxin system
MSPILLDTHAALWAASKSLAPEVKATVSAAAERGELLISPISAWEIGVLVRKGRIRLLVPVEEYVRSLFRLTGVVTAQLSPVIALAATTLPGAFHADPADRLLVATAAEYGARFVTRDKKIHAYARATNYLKCLAC